MISQTWRFFRQHVSLSLAIGLLIIVVGMGIFASLADAVLENDSLVGFDEELAMLLHEGARPRLTTVLRITTLFGSEVVAGIGIVVGLLYIWRRQWPYLVTWLFALVGGQLANQGLKTIFARDRPFFEEPLAVAKYYSFPSGHAMMSMITYGLIAYLLTQQLRNRHARIIVWISAAALILLIGFSRMYLGVHYLSDVLGGYAAGAAWLALSILMLGVLLQRSTVPPPDPAEQQSYD